MFQLPSPLQKIETALTRQFNIHLFIKRDDLIHPEISGNKWRKLKYNIEQAKQENKTTILTFGGAYSNHITATAAAGKYFGLRTIGIIRGEAYQPLNKSLKFATDCGMELVYVDREKYKTKNMDSFLTTQDSRLIYFLPEGGANELALKGCAEITNELDVDFDYICCACGTGTTIAGIASNLKPHQQAIGFAVLKHDKLQEEIIEKFPNLKSEISILNSHFGGYA
ncbi:MAG TPA: pyridoxal-phosphate dependent enzyme, partial [Chitinophagales bacterium]|nr:pyridoxal-phosphate dependent enzyme [Chitinophagales bacterium]